MSDIISAFEEYQRLLTAHPKAKEHCVMIQLPSGGKEAIHRYEPTRAIYAACDAQGVVKVAKELLLN